MELIRPSAKTMFPIMPHLYLDDAWYSKGQSSSIVLLLGIMVNITAEQHFIH